MLLIFKSYFAGKRIPRTESGLVGGNCAGCNTHKAHKSEWSWSDQELEYEDAEYGSDQSVDGSGLNNFHSLGFLCVPGGFSGTVLA